jgi:hypothetical protein
MSDRSGKFDSPCQPKVPVNVIDDGFSSDKDVVPDLNTETWEKSPVPEHSEEYLLLEAKIRDLNRRAMEYLSKE